MSGFLVNNHNVTEKQNDDSAKIMRRIEHQFGFNFSPEVFNLHNHFKNKMRIYSFMRFCEFNHGRKEIVFQGKGANVCAKFAFDNFQQELSEAGYSDYDLAYWDNDRLAFMSWKKKEHVNATPEQIDAVNSILQSF